MYHLAFVPRDPALAVFARQYMLDAAGTTAYEALRTCAAHAEPAEAVEWLTDIALTDPRESVRTTAISYLAVDLAAVGAVERLVGVLQEPPAVTWAVHIAILDGLRKLGMPAPRLGHLAAVDNLDLFQSVVFLRCATD